MKKPVTCTNILLLLGLLLGAAGCQFADSSPEAALKNVDAVQAMAIANDWKWIDKTIKSYVTPGEVVFEFPEKKVKKIPLPEDKMLVAVAPYISKTHQ